MRGGIARIKFDCPGQKLTRTHELWPVQPENTLDRSQNGMMSGGDLGLDRRLKRRPMREQFWINLSYNFYGNPILKRE